MASKPNRKVRKRKLKSKDSIVSTTNTSTSLCSVESETQVNCKEETIFSFYEALLPLIVEEWSPINSINNTYVTTNEDVLESKNFKDVSQNDLKNSVSSIDGSNIIFASKSSTNSKDACQKDLKNSALNVDESKMSRDSKISRSDTSLSASLKISTLTSVKSMKPQEAEYFLIKFKNGNVYVGEIENKHFHGNGKFTWADGSTYEGDFRDGDITGHGTINFKDQSRYTGDVCKGFLHGQGHLYVFETSLIYSGSWKRGKRHGKGWIIYSPGNWYEGEWVEDMEHGCGVRQYEENSRYQGMWYEGKHHGKGTMVWCNKDVYIGQWVHGVMEGYGMYVWNSFFNDTLTFHANITYNGWWKEGMRHGVGNFEKLLHYSKYSTGANFIIICTKYLNQNLYDIHVVFPFSQI